MRPAKSQARWYGICPGQKSDSDSQTVSGWSVSASKLNSSYSRIARKAGMASTPPASRRICRGQTSKLLENLAGSGCRAESCSNPERGLYPSLSDPAKTHKVSHGHKLVCQSPQEQLPAGGITSAYGQKCCRTGKTSNISGFFNRLFLVPKPNNK